MKKTNPINLSAAGLKPGDRIDKFEVVEPIGAGGMSTLWKGYDRLLDQHVAIKQITLEEGAQDNEEALLERFRSEAQVQKRLSQQHRNLVRVIEFVEDPRGLFVVMDFIDGVSLEQVIAGQSGPMDQRQALGIIGAAAQALAVIHQTGVVHRDLKPANILMPRGGGLKVCDFGLASLIGDQQAMGVGTVRYMAPELFREGPVDGRADLYSLGLIAYEMLAGRAKFNEAFKIVLRDQRNQAMRWMKWHTNLRAAAPPLNTLNPAVPKTLADLVARMMEKDPDQRIASAEQLLEAIRRHFTGQSASATLAAGEDVDLVKAQAAAPAALAEPTARLPRKNRLPVILGAVLLAQVVLGVGAFMIWQVLQARQEQQLADADNEKRFKAAMDDLKAGVGAATADLEAPRLALAKQGFEDVAQRTGSANLRLQNEGLHKKAQAHVRYIEGLLAFAEHRYQDALKAYKLAEELRVIDRDKLRQRRDEAEFRDYFEKVVQRIEDQIAASQYDVARQTRQLILESKNLQMTEDDKKRLNELGDRIEDQKVHSSIAEVLQKARDLHKSGQPDQAKRLLFTETKKYPARRDLQALLESFNRETQFASLLAAREAAEAAGDMNEAIRLGDQVVAQAPDDAQRAAAQTKLTELKAAAALKEGKEKQAAGDIDGARAAFHKAQNYGHPEAAKFLADIKSANELAVVIKAGDDAVRGGDLTAAIGHYQTAIKMGAAKDVDDKLKAARIALRIKEGRALLQAGKLDAARASFVEALKDDDANADGKQGVVESERWKDYRARLDAGDRLANLSKFGDAKREYGRALDILASPEMTVRAGDPEYSPLLAKGRKDIDDRLTDVEYRSLVASARREMAAKNWAAAEGWAIAAQRLRDTEEAGKLLAEIRANKPKQPEQQ